MSKKEKKSAVPEQYKDIDFNKELTNVGLNPVNAPQMTPKTNIGETALEETQKNFADAQAAVEATKNNPAIQAVAANETGADSNDEGEVYASNLKDRILEDSMGEGKAVSTTGEHGTEVANTLNENGHTETIEQKPEITGNEEQDKSNAVNKTEQKKKFQLKSIMQAYYDHEIDEETRDYLLVDTFAKAARNISKDLANVSAAYTGGSINNEPNEESMWSQRNKEVAASGIESEKAAVEGSREWREAQMDALNRKALNNEVLNAEDRRNMAKLVQSYLYDENGKLKYDPNDATFKSLMTEYNQLMNGGAIGGSMMKNFLDKLITTIGI